MYLTESENYRIFYPQKNLNFKFTVFDYISNDFEIGISGNDYLFFKFKSGIIKDFQNKLVGTFNSEPITINAYLKDGLFDYYLNNKEIAREYSINPTSVFSAISAKILDGGDINLEPYIYGSDIPTLSFLKFYSNESVSGQIVNNGSYRIKVFSADSPNTSGEWIFPQYLIPNEVSNFFNYDISGYSDGDIIYLNLDTSFGNNLYSLQITNDGTSPNPDDENTIEEPIALAYSSINLISGQINNFELSTGIYRIDYESTLTNTANLTFNYLTGKFLDLEVSKTLDYPLIYQGTLLGDGDGKGSGTLFPTKAPRAEFYSIDSRNRKYVDFYLSGDGSRDFEDIYLTGEVTYENQVSNLKVDLDDQGLFYNNDNKLIDYGGKYLPLQSLDLIAKPNYKYLYLNKFLTLNITGDSSVILTGIIPDSSYEGKYTFYNPESLQKNPFLFTQKIQGILPSNITLRPYRGVAFHHLASSNNISKPIKIYGFTSTNDSAYESKFIDSWKTPQMFPFWLGDGSPYLNGAIAGSTGGTTQCTIDIDNAATVLEDGSDIFGYEFSENKKSYISYLTGCNISGCYVSGTNCFISGDFSIKKFPDPEVQPLQTFSLDINKDKNNIIFFKNLPTIDYGGQYTFNLNENCVTGIILETENTLCQRRDSTFSSSLRIPTTNIIDQMVLDTAIVYSSLSPFKNIERPIEKISLYTNDTFSSSASEVYSIDWNSNNFICLSKKTLKDLRRNIGYFDDIYFLYTRKINNVREQYDSINLINDFGYSEVNLENPRYIKSLIDFQRDEQSKPIRISFSRSDIPREYRENHIINKFNVINSSNILIPFISEKINYVFSFIISEDSKNIFNIKINDSETELYIEDYYQNYKRIYVFFEPREGLSFIKISFKENKNDVLMGAFMLEKSYNRYPSYYTKPPMQYKTSILFEKESFLRILFNYFTFRLAGIKSSFMEYYIPPRRRRKVYECIGFNQAGEEIEPWQFVPSFWDRILNAKFDSTNNRITVSGTNFENGEIIYFMSIVGGGTDAERGLSINTSYYVRNVVGNTFQLSSTLNGAIIDFQYVYGATLSTTQIGLKAKNFLLKYIIGHLGPVQELPTDKIDKFFLCSRNNINYLSIKKVGKDLYVDNAKIIIDEEDEYIKNIILDKIDYFFTDYESETQSDLINNYPKTFYVGKNKIFKKIYGDIIPDEYNDQDLTANIQIGYARYYNINNNDGFFWPTENFYTVRNDKLFNNDGAFKGLAPNFERLNEEAKYITSEQVVSYYRILKTSGDINMYFPTTSPGQTVYLTKAEMSIPYGEESVWTGVFENFEKKTSDVWDVKLSDDIEGTQNIMKILSPTAEYVETFRLEGIGNSDNDEFLEKTKYLTIKNKWDIASGIADEVKIIFDITNSQKEILFSSEVNIP